MLTKPLLLLKYQLIFRLRNLYHDSYLDYKTIDND